VNRRARCVAAMIFVALPIATAGPAAAECATLDLTCSVGDVVDTGEGITGGVAGTVDGVAGTVDGVTGTVEDAVGSARDTIEDVLDPVGEEPPPPTTGGGDGGKTDGTDDDPKQDEASNDEPSVVGAAPGPGGPGDTDERPPTGSRRSSGLSPALSPSPAGFEPQPGVSQIIGSAIAHVLPSLAAVLALLGVAAAFVLVQDRLDRRDPRLVLAPVDADLVRFV